jgi:hypothetical protein
LIDGIRNGCEVDQREPIEAKTMRKIDGFGETQDVAVTVVVDNRADLI